MSATANTGAAALEALRKHSQAVRSAVVTMAHTGKTAHVASALSCVDLLVALYFHALDVDPKREVRDNPDRFIMSKGHGCMAYYATLAERGFFPRDLLATYSQNGSVLAEHPSPHGIPGCEVATGSLGHGLSIAAGVALGHKLSARPGRAFALLSDGECNEGSVWEAAMFASGRHLDNLIVLVDYNNLQAMGRSNEVTGLAPLAEKWSAFGFATREVDGHNLQELAAALGAAPFEAGRPTALVCHTVKGKGVSFMEDDLEWHYRPPSADDLKRALAELGT